MTPKPTISSYAGLRYLIPARCSQEVALAGLFGMSRIRSNRSARFAARCIDQARRQHRIFGTADPGISLARSHAFNIRGPQELRAKLLPPRTSPPGPFSQPRVRSQNRARDLGDGG